MHNTSAVRDALSPLIGEMMSGPQALKVLKDELRGRRNTAIVLASAYIKELALRELSSVIEPENCVRVLVRWQLKDLIGGASDLACFPFARARGWRFFVRQGLHAKVYGVGDSRIFLGSANLTRSGFGLEVFANEEAVVCVGASEGNLRFMERMFDGSVEMSESLYQQIEQWLTPRLQGMGERNDPDDRWPEEIGKHFESTNAPQRLLVSECFWTNGAWLQNQASTPDAASNEALSHDLSLLEIRDVDILRGLSAETIASAVEKTRVFRWAMAQIQMQPSREVYFGQIAVLLHDALVNDPKPYRREVKELVRNLYGWIATTGASGLQVDRPGHSERIRAT